MKQKVIKILCCSLLCIGINSISIFAQNLDKTYKWEYDVNQDVEMHYNNHNWDTKIETTSGDKVVFEITLNASGDKDKLNILDDYFNDLTFKSSKEKVEVFTAYYSSMSSIAGRVTVTLKNGKKIKLSKLKYSAVLKIPASSMLYLTSKYSKINIGNINNLRINSHDDDIYGQNVARENALIINAKYSKVVFNDIGNAKISVHDCSLDFTRTLDLVINAKYSDFDITKAQNVKIISHDDEFDFTETGAVNMTAKYSDFNSRTSGDMEFRLHDSNIKVGVAGNMLIRETKYSDYVMDKLQNVKIGSSHDDNYIFRELDQLMVTSTKYSEYRCGKVFKQVNMKAGHDDNISIEEIMPTFEAYYQNGKYADTKISINPKLDFKLELNGKYVKFDNNLGKLKINIDKKNDDGTRTVEGLHGTQKENMVVFNINGYDCNVKFQ